MSLCRAGFVCALHVAALTACGGGGGGDAPPGASATVSGTISFQRIPFQQDPSDGLNYGSPQVLPARGIRVEALAASQQVLATATTDAAGAYSVQVPASTPVSIRAIAEMVRTAPQWQFRVLDDANGSQVYSFSGAAFDSSAPGANANLVIPSGWSSSGSIAGTRAAAPFAILDTLYTTLTAVQAIEPGLDFPPLDVDWGPGNPGGQTFYQGGPGTPRIVLSGEANVDTDEYDQHVIAHEFGHYIEDQFSRSDSIGGQHGAGDRLDPRVAFGEGFGYAFASIVLGDPVQRDSFGPGQAQSGNFDVERNVWTNPGWFSEASTWSILWDLHDPANDDPAALGLAALWQVLRDEQASTAALTSIFPFVAALKARDPGSAQSIDAIVTLQDIDSSSIEPFGSTETNTGGYPDGDVHPIYTPIAVGQSRTVRSVAPDQTGSGPGQNKLSNHRFLKLTLGAPQSVRFRVTAPAGRDADIAVIRQGNIVRVGQEPADEDFTIANLPAGEYVLDVYDCENAECTDQPSFDYQPTDITVTLSSN